MVVLHRFHCKMIIKYDIKDKQYHLIIIFLLDIGMFNFDDHGPDFGCRFVLVNGQVSLA